MSLNRLPFQQRYISKLISATTLVCCGYMKKGARLTLVKKHPTFVKRKHVRDSSFLSKSISSDLTYSLNPCHLHVVCPVVLQLLKILLCRFAPSSTINSDGQQFQNQPNTTERLVCSPGEAGSALQLHYVFLASL